MNIEKIITLKIISFDIDKGKFENIINLLNKSGYKFKISEDPCYGAQDNSNNIRINLFNKNKIDFMIVNSVKTEKLKYCINTFLDNCALFFKAISLEFGRIYNEVSAIKTTFINPEFTDENKLKYKLSTEIKTNEAGIVLIVTNYHFYNFKNVNNDCGISGIIKTEILDKLNEYINDYEKSFED